MTAFEFRPLTAKGMLVTISGNSAHTFLTHIQLYSAGKCGMYFVEDNASDTVESSVSRSLSLH